MTTEAWGDEAHRLSPLWPGKAGEDLMAVLRNRTVGPCDSASTAGLSLRALGMGPPNLHFLLVPR